MKCRLLYRKHWDERMNVRRLFFSCGRRLFWWEILNFLRGLAGRGGATKTPGLLDGNSCTSFWETRLYSFIGLNALQSGWGTMVVDVIRLFQLARLLSSFCTLVRIMAGRSFLSFSFILSFRLLPSPSLHSHSPALSVFITTLRTFSTSSQVNPSYKLFQRPWMETLDRSRFRCLWENLRDSCRLKRNIF